MKAEEERDDWAAEHAQWTYVPIERQKHRAEWEAFYCGKVVPVMWVIGLLLVALAAWRVW